MPLRKFTRAHCRSARRQSRQCVKSTGPRTSPGKARVSFNSFKRGRYAVRPEKLAERLLRAGHCREAALYCQVRWQISQTFRPQGEAGWNRLYRLSAWVWCFRTRFGRARSKLGPKPECALFSVGEEPRPTSRTRIRDPYRRIGIWVERRPRWNPEEGRAGACWSRTGAGAKRSPARGEGPFDYSPGVASSRPENSLQYSLLTPCQLRSSIKRIEIQGGVQDMDRRTSNRARTDLRIPFRR
jgi:hypothetical protein